MPEINYSVNIKGLFEKLGIDQSIEAQTALSGGHLHRVYRVKTHSHEYAVKALNPNVLLRPRAMRDYINTENIASIASKTINACAANRYGDKIVQEFQGQYYLVYEYIDGTTIMNPQISAGHCEKMGKLLALIHAADFSELGLADDYSSIETAVDWSYYLHLGIERNAPWTGLMSESLSRLYIWNERLISASAQLSEGTVISHGDLEPKNVLWKDGEPIIIDWEAAGFVHPAYDMLETAVYWAKEADGSINKDKFMAFIKAYRAITGINEVRWSTVLNKGFVMLGWLEYSLKRSLWIECSDIDEQAMGTEHVFGTIQNLEQYDKMLPQLAGWLAEA